MADKKTKKASRVAATKNAAAKKTATITAGKAVKKREKKASPPALPARKTAKKAAAKKTAKNKVAKKVVAKKRSPKKDEECFLTTACVNYYSLADDSYELATLRTFRDQYMLRSSEGKALVTEYYRIAPLIVSKIKKDKEHQKVYRYIYQRIQKACAEIEQKQNAIAQQTYTALVAHLSKKYSLPF